MSTESTQARGAKLEVLQRHAPQFDDHGLIVPDAVLINGIEILVPEGAAVEIHPLTNKDCAKATVTFFVSELIVRTAVADKDPTAARTDLDHLKPAPRTIDEWTDKHHRDVTELSTR